MKKFVYFTLSALLLASCVGENGSRRSAKVATPAKDSLVTPPAPIKSTVNVYIENSGSMDGYVNGVTEFERTVYNYISDISILDFAASLNLYYINNQIISDTSDIADFIQKLEPSTFKMKGGNRATSDIANVLKTVLKETSANKTSIFVTDGIFSPGKDKDASQYLLNQQIGIKRIFSDFLKNNNTAAVMVYQLQSNFNGTYYDYVDAKSKINENRPFYIWVIGDVKQLCDLRKKIADDKLKKYSAEQHLNVFTVMNGMQMVKYAINPSLGRFKKSRVDNKTIEDLEKDNRSGKVKFGINVDFSNLLLDESYLLNPENYENSSNYDLEIKPSATKGYTHTLIFTADRIYAVPVTVKLKTDIPAWINETNDDEGVKAIPNKTYGIKYQLEGVFDAFTISNKYYTEIKITIK
jgi:hypothetical protein